jgi:hypothetical protein
MWRVYACALAFQILAMTTQALAIVRCFAIRKKPNPLQGCIAFRISDLLWR